MLLYYAVVLLKGDGVMTRPPICDANEFQHCTSRYDQLV